MTKLGAIYLFYKKLFLLTLVFSVLIGSISQTNGGSFISAAGKVFIILTPIFHYFLYEVRYPNEYYFYYNLGFSKLQLWLISLLIGFIFGSTLIVL